jgi:hypothetical protein
MNLLQLRDLISSPVLYYSLYGGFVALNVLDGHSTWKVIKPHHFNRERNPVARWVFRKLGIPRGIIIFKGLLLAGLTIAFFYYGSYDLFTLNIVLLVADLVFLFVVLHNYRIHRKMNSW